MNPVPDLETDTRVLATLKAHRAREQTVVGAYQPLADESSDEAVQYLCRMVIDDDDDDERRRAVVDEMSNRIESWIEGKRVDPSTPILQPKVDAGLLEATQELIDLERDDAKELRLLQRELRYAPATSLLPLLAELMLQDTERHIEVLVFIRAYTG